MIPKVINYVWFVIDHETPQEIPKFKNCIENNKRFLNDFEIKTWTRKMCENLVKNNFPEYYEWYMSLKKDILRIDYIRYFIMYTEGGYYTDYDILLLSNLPLGGEETLFFVESDRRNDYIAQNIINLFTGNRSKIDMDDVLKISQGIFASEKGNNIWLRILEEGRRRIERNPNYLINDNNNNNNLCEEVFYLSGPALVTHIVNRSKVKLFSLFEANKIFTHTYANSWVNTLKD